MRQYRGRRKDNGEWVYGWYVKDWEGGSHIVTEFGPYKTHCWDCGANEQESFKVDPDTVGQWTGLCDKNWNMIYEGDIVKGHRWVNGKSQRLVGKVEYVANKYVVTGIGKYSWNEQDDLNGSYEIIGNIHDHPHLLKGDENE